MPNVGTASADLAGDAIPYCTVVKRLRSTPSLNAFCWAEAEQPVPLRELLIQPSSLAFGEIMAKVRQFQLVSAVWHADMWETACAQRSLCKQIQKKKGQSHMNSHARCCFSLVIFGGRTLVHC